MKSEVTKTPQLKPTNGQAFISLIAPTILALSAGFLIWNFTGLWFWIGQLLLSFFFLQCFIILHECGHLNFFKTRQLNEVFGHVFGFLSGIPFYSWQQMHHLHHRWTGWRDKDPTTEGTIAPSKSKVTNAVVNIAWKLFIPLFYMSYKISNYWNLGKIKRFVNTTKYTKIKIQVTFYLAIYVLVFVMFYSFIWHYILPAFILSLVWKELVIMTQHSHVEMPIAAQNEVKPFSYMDQVQYTRSFYVNQWFAKYFLLNFNLHEVHHAYPGLPAYRLHEVDLLLPHEPTYFTWLKKAKSMSGVDYVFKTTKQTGIKI
jgi:omega-6 fatty acid desaturase (delta-12 desaturase)